MGDAARSLTDPQIAGIILLFLATVGTLCVVGTYIDLWNPALATDTVFWFFGVGIALLFRIDEAGDPRFFREAVARTLKITALIAFITNLFVFNLWVELVIQPLLLVFVVGAYNSQNPSAKRVGEWGLALVGSGMLAFTAMRLAQEWGEVDPLETFRGLLLPVWLTLGILPFIYFFALLSAYQGRLKRMGLALGEQSPSWPVRFAMLVSFHGRLAELESVDWRWLCKTGTASSFREAQRRIAEFREDQRSIAAEAKAAIDRLERFAGASGTDADGRRLDQREFNATKKALELLGSAQMGWYRNRGGRYRTDLAEILSSRFEEGGLPQPHGIDIDVSQGGQSWYASRRTISGWYFGIGSANAPPDQWFYDGPEPPSGFPGGASACGVSLSGRRRIGEVGPLRPAG